MNHPVIDLHCDLLSYLEGTPNADANNRSDIGCSIPALEQGNVKLQVMALYTATDKGSATSALEQSLIFKNLPGQYPGKFSFVNDIPSLHAVADSAAIGIVAAIENASGFCEEDETLDQGFKNLQEIIANCGRILYIGLTHHGENRFGGGNASRTGLKEDGKVLLDYMSGQKIALDFSHTSDALAYDLLDYITKRNLRIPVIASHSNYRNVFDHPRNLPDELAKEIIKRHGLIGVNFLRAFLNDKDPGAMRDHILYGLGLGGEKAVCFGADYFHTGHHPDQSRVPFYFKEHDSAARYPDILHNLSEKVPTSVLENISYKNVIHFLERTWS